MRDRAPGCLQKAQTSCAFDTQFGRACQKARPRPLRLHTSGSQGTNKGIAEATAARTFVDDEDFRAQPARARLLVLPDASDQCIDGFSSQTNASKGMDGHAPDIARGDT